MINMSIELHLPRRTTMVFPSHDATSCGLGGRDPFLHQSLLSRSPPLQSVELELSMFKLSDSHQVLDLGPTLTPSTAEDRPPDPIHDLVPTTASSNYQPPMHHDGSPMVKPRRGRGRRRGSKCRIQTIKPASKTGRVKAENKAEPPKRKGAKYLQKPKSEEERRERKKRAYEACTHCRYRRQKVSD